MQELEETKSIRLAQLTTENSILSESFNLQPKKLNFDNCSQQSN